MIVIQLPPSLLLYVRAHLCGFGYPRQPSPRVTLAEVTFTVFLSKIQQTVYIRSANSSRGTRQLGWASCLTSVGRVTLASGETFLLKRFGSPTRDSSRRGECHVMPRFRIYISLRPHLYGLRYPRQPSPRVTLAEVTFNLFLSKLQPTVYIKNTNSSRGARQLGWASCLAPRQVG